VRTAFGGRTFPHLAGARERHSGTEGFLIVWTSKSGGFEVVGVTEGFANGHLGDLETDASKGDAFEVLGIARALDKRSS
jgi:hypothetical protein